MATLERIRRRSGVLLTVIGLAMAAFILTDLLGSGDSLLRNNANVVGEAKGKEIDIRDFNSRVDERMTLLQQQNPQQASNITRIQVAEQIWTEFLQEQILGERYDKLGISVTDRELFDRIVQNQQIQQQQSFRDQVTGQFSPAALQQYIESIQDNRNTDADAAQAFNQWLNFENSTRDQALRDKYLYVVRKGIYMPSALAKSEYTRENEFTVMNYLGLELSSIADSAVSYTDSDLKDYYKKNKSQYKTKDTRNIAFVSFKVEASPGDRSRLKAELSEYLQPQILNVRGRIDTFPSFQEAEDDSSFAVGRSDVRVQARYVTQDEVEAPLDTILFEQELNYVHGPYEEDDFFVLTKISDIKMMPDSVRSRHILISYQGANEGQSTATRAPQRALELADSLVKVLKQDSTQFADLARAYSDDPGSGDKGGDLGWYGRGQMVPAFDRFSFINETGTIGMVESRFGLHIIQIMDAEGSNKALKLVHIRRSIEPSDDTRDSVYNRSSNFAGQVTDGDFSEIAEREALAARVANELGAFDEMILGVGQNREIVRWAHNEETNVGDIQLFNHNNSSYIVVQLTAAKNEGYASLEEVREEIIDAVIDEKKKDLLVQKLKEAAEGAQSINDIAQKLGASVKNQSINFATSNLTGFGSEPKVVGRASILPINQISEPIRGDRGVYVLSVSERVSAEDLPDYNSQRIETETKMQNLAGSQVFESLKEATEIVDKRAKFF